MKVLRSRELAELAVEDTKLEDFGGDDFSEALDLIAEEVAAQPPTERGVMAFNGYAKGLLANRLRIVADRKADRAIAAQTVSRPLFVVGLPRTGTTFLQALLAQDPNGRSLLQWEAARPSPPPRQDSYASDPRIALNIAESPHDPGFAQRHIHGAQLPVECGAALGYAFCTGTTYFLWHTASQLERLQGEIRPGYRWHRLVLEHLQSHTAQSHWVLKSPEHFGHMVELVEAYPDARIVVTHRDPLKIIPSVSSLAAYMQRMNLPAFPDTRVGPEKLAYWTGLTEKFMAFRNGAGRNVKMLDLHYRELTAAPMTAVEKIYDAYDMPLTAEAERAMTAWLKAYNQDSYQREHGAHDYTLEEYGLNADDIRHRFRPYIEAYLG